MRGPGLLGRLALALALVGLLPVGFAVRSLIGINRTALIEQAESLHLVAARTTAQQIVQFLDSRQALAVSLARDSALADSRSAAAQRALARSLTAWQGLGVEGLVVVSPEGDEAIRAQLADEPARQRVAAGVAAPPGDEFLLIPGEGPPVVRLQAELPGAAGLLWLICDGSEIRTALDAYELGEQADLMLVGSGRRALIGDQALVDEFPDQIVDQILNTGLTGVKTDFVSRLDGRRFIGAWATVPQARWAVFSRQPLEVAQSVERRMWRQSWWAVGGALALIALASVFAYLSVVRPVRQVAAAQRRLAGLPARGDGGNEIGQLRAAFEALERRISDQERLDEVFLGRYQVSDVIGSGAMGTVFRGWDPKLKRPVALKTVRLDTKLKGKHRQELVERLLTEAVTVARFNHPNIVSIFDVEDHPDGAYVAMELVDGNSLEQALWRGQRMSPDRSCHWVWQSARPWPPPTSTASSTGTSSRPTCCWARMARSRSPISASPNCSRRWRRVRTWSSAHPVSCRPKPCAARATTRRVICSRWARCSTPASSDDRLSTAKRSKRSSAALSLASSTSRASWCRMCLPSWTS